MPDILSAYARSQPDKLAVVDDKPDGTVISWTYAELEVGAAPSGAGATAPG